MTETSQRRAIADDAFLSHVGHDLRGELATIIAGVHYLLRYEKGLSDTAKQMLGRVDGAGQRLRALLDEFDQASWIGGGDASRLLKAPCTIADVVALAIGGLAPQLEARAVEVRVDAKGPVPDVSADAELLGAALAHLIDFASARSIGAPVMVVIDANDGYARVAVSDSGGEVDDAIATQLAEPFVEKQAAPRRTEGGSKRRERLGLGLAIAAGMLQAHGGALRVERTADGLTLVAELPT